VRRGLVAVGAWAAGNAFPQQGTTALSRAIGSKVLGRRRRALVIGNDNYVSISRLSNARNDAHSVAAELVALEFEVNNHVDLSYTSMVDAVDTFVDGLGPNDDVVVFYAGHGVQVPRVGNFLLPVDVSVGNANRLERTAYSLDQLTAQLGDANARFTLVIVDACRDNPFLGRSASTGFAGVEAAKGQMVVFSSSKNQTALDRLSRTDSNRNSVFTRELLKVLRQPELSIGEAMQVLQERVERLAASVGKEQRPAIYSEVRGRYYLHPQGSAAAAASGATLDPELELWNAIRHSEVAADFEEYLRLYPTGKFASSAKSHVRRLSVAQRAPMHPSPSASTPASGGTRGSPDKDAELPARKGHFVPPAN
jgi:hypothetical protein